MQLHPSCLHCNTDVETSHCKFNILCTVHRDVFVQYEPTGCTIYFQFILIINLYMFQAGLLLIIRRYLSVYIAVGMCHALCWLSGVPRNFVRGGEGGGEFNKFS